jgi:hypothetical protein
MNKEEISKLLKLPFPELARICQSPETLASVLSLAIKIGIGLGQKKTCEDYGKAFRGYTKILLSN